MIQAAFGLAMAAVWPAIASLAILFLIRFATPQRKVASWAYVVAFVAAYCLGHALAAGAEFTFRPSRNWHWLFYLVPIAGVAGVLSTSPRASWFNRCFLIAVLAVLTAGLLTTRPNLWAPRSLFIAAIFVYLIACWLTFEPLASRLEPARISAAFWLAAAALAAMIAEQISLTDGGIVASAAGALAGICIFALITKSVEPTAAFAVPVAIALGGWAWKEVLTESRLWPLLILPLAPATLWLTQSGPLARLGGIARMATQLAVTFVVIVVAAILIRGFADG